MAKYTVKFSCGHTEEISLVGKVSERERKIDYYERYGLCSECYKCKKNAEKAERGLEFKAKLLPYIDEENGKALVMLYFDGDTYNSKNEIKALGYKWSVVNGKQCWNKVTNNQAEAKAEAKKAQEIGAETFLTKKEFWDFSGKVAVAEKLHEWQETHKEAQQNDETKSETTENTSESEAKAEPKKIEEPAIIKGHYWNKKIYGKSGYYNIYLDSKKTEISDEQKSELEAYVASL